MSTHVESLALAGGLGRLCLQVWGEEIGWGLRGTLVLALQLGYTRALRFPPPSPLITAPLYPQATLPFRPPSPPRSTTHATVGAVAGVGLLEGRRGFNWRLLCKFFVGWVATIIVVACTSAAFTAQVCPPAWLCLPEPAVRAGVCRVVEGNAQASSHLSLSFPQSCGIQGSSNTVLKYRACRPPPPAAGHLRALSHLL